MNAIISEKFISPSDLGLSPTKFTTPADLPGGLPRFPAPALPSETKVAELVQDNDRFPADSPPRDILQRYLREIGQVKLLTRDEEVALAERIQRGDAVARDQMINANLRLVVKIARDYEGFGLPLLDLISEGNIGLMKGVERFEPTKGAKLSTYVSWWIKQAIKQALSNQSNTIRLPIHVTHKVSHIRRSAIKLRETLHREATDAELAHDLELNPRRVRQYREVSRAPICLDSPISDDDATTLSETIADENAAAPYDGLVEDNDNNLVNEVLATLDARESKILAMRFGLDDGSPKSLEEVAERFGVTRERIRQIQEQGLKKMRERIGKRDPLSRPLKRKKKTAFNRLPCGGCAFLHSQFGE
jgi:RNA polymerase primary sigma factor